jgi:5-hydroxyisourate hydrolase
MTWLTTHVLDASTGQPAAGVVIDIYRVESDDGRAAIARAVTDRAGRCELLSPGAGQAGLFEVLFHAGDYFRGAGVALGNPPLLDQIPVRVGLAAGESFHVPLIMTPWAYSVYRGR